MAKQADATKDLLGGAGKLFDAKENLNVLDNKEDIPEAERKGVMDQANVCMLIPKKKWVLDTLKNNFRFEDADFKPLPKLDYVCGLDHAENEIVSKYAGLYLRIMLEMTKHSEYLIMKIKPDYPIWIECEDFIYIIAPRVECD